MMGTKGRIAILLAVCALLLSMGGGSYALAKKSAELSTSSLKETGSDPATSGHKKPKKHSRKGKHRIINARLTVRDKKAPGGFATVTIARGVLSSSGDGRVTVNEDDGTAATFTPASDTRVMVNKRQGSVNDVTSGMKGRVRSKQVPGQQDEVKKVRAHTPKRNLV